MSQSMARSKPTSAPTAEHMELCDQEVNAELMRMYREQTNSRKEGIFSVDTSFASAGKQTRRREQNRAS
jgi:hypothetical protein